MRSKPAAVFMAFGTKGDIYPLAAIAAAFACDQEQYQVVFITHSAHENLMVHLRANKVTYIPVSSPPVVSPLVARILQKYTTFGKSDTHPLAFLKSPSNIGFPS
ncbi:hypothetical protein H5410_010786 [Solanum commersonii]|uniref:Uncharacterized protein n=1 Tax=Solanum commersonii TaxID=4109 RepID=A0A9J6ALN9_SOLCO|nr:hypothetical protein H5410_010786 [Solanum commersonii]